LHYSFKQTRGVAHCHGIRRYRTRDYRSGADCGFWANVCHYDGCCTNPAIRANNDGHEFLFIRSHDTAIGSAQMLVPPTQYLNMAGNLRPFTNHACTYHAVAADVDTPAYTDGTLSTKASKGYSAIQRTSSERADVISNTEIIAGKSRHQREQLRKSLKDRRKTAESGKRRKGQRHRKAKRLDKCLDCTSEQNN
jgi:hypothetical protein